jgi:uncharacterized phage infection (PIP) family protein YhgE
MGVYKKTTLAAAGIILLGLITITGCTGAEKTGDKKTVQIEKDAKLQQETNQLKIENALQEKVVKAYEKSVTDLRGSLVAIITLALAAIGLLVFRNTREYKEAKDEAKEAAKEAKETAKDAEKAAEKARDWETKAQKTFNEIDTKVNQKLEEIEIKAKKPLNL